MNTAGLNRSHGLDSPQIILPMMGLVERDTAQALAEYTARGGLLIGFARCGTLDENGWFYHQQPEPHLGQAFGIASLEPDTLADPTIEMDGEAYAGYWNRDLLKPLPGTEILARFADGWPAVTLARHGRGYGVYIATQADAAHLKHSPSLLKAVLRKVHRRLALTPRLQVLAPQQAVRLIDPHLLEDGPQSLLIVGNYHHEPQDVTVSIRDERKGIRAAQVYPLAADVSWTQTGSKLSLSFDMASKEVKIFKIDWD
jgi:beta-galactosidase GanA